jgi:hypothetical protein
MEYSLIVPMSCATISDCQDTAPAPDLSWLVIPAVILVVVVIAVVVYFTIKGSRGL